MRTKLILFGFLAVLVLSSFILFNPSSKKILEHQASPPPANGGWDKFYLGAMDTQYGTASRFDSLGLTIWHRYISRVYNDTLGKHVPSGWTANDYLLAPVSTYASTINSKLNEIYSNSPSNNRRKVLLVRPKITWLCYGQSSKYQCEPVSGDLWFYSFNDTLGQAVSDSGSMVMKCTAGQQSAGYVVKRLKANTEQCQNYFNTSEWEGDLESTWYVKPRIRIPAAFPSINPNSPVCIVEVVKTDGTTLVIRDTIRAIHFRDEFNQYNGEYKEEFLNLLNPNFLQFDGSLSTQSLAFSARGTKPINDESSYQYKSDIRVYWSGNCDMWIDYVKVENDVAHNLLTTDITNQTHNLFLEWLEDEAALIGNHAAAFKYYLEYSAFNNIPCLKYVNDKLKFHTNGRVDLMQDLHYRIAEHVPWDKKSEIYNAEFLSEHYINAVGFTQVFTECYPLFSCYYSGGASQSYYSKIPNTLPTHFGPQVLAEDVNPLTYDSWLQESFDTQNWKEGGAYETCNTTICNNDTSRGLALDKGSFRMQLQLGNEISKISNVPFILMPQAHQWFLPGEVRREPTNEELDMMTNVAVSYGAKGLQYFWYPSYPNPQSPTDCEYGTGMANSNGNLRMTNVYGQDSISGFRDKKKVIKDIHDRLSNKWGPYLMAFNNDTNSYIYRDPDERAEMVNNGFISKLKAYTPVEFAPEDPGTPDFDALPIDSNDNVFLQAAFFTKPDDPVSEHNKYFMIVNRRCSPYLGIGSLDSIGGRRLVDMKINPDKFPNFSNWVIYDIETGDSVAAFHKNSGNYVYIGDFMPGQGKLFRVSPIMQEGGTLLGDEICGGSGVSVNCKDDVYNGGFDLTIAPDTEILFNEGKKIVMDEGDFICGGVRESLAPILQTDITLKGITGSTYWDGIQISNCNMVSVGGTRFERIRNDTLYALDVVNCNTLKVRYSLFLSGSNNKQTGSVSFNFLPMLEAPLTPPVIEITGNQFYHNSSSIPSVQVMTFSSGQTSTLIRNNELYGYGSSVGIFLSNITGGAVKSNYINNYGTGISASTSYIDLYKNTVSNTSNTSNGLSLNFNSVANMNFNSSIVYQNSGMNVMTNTYASSRNILTDNSYFGIGGGFNKFDVTEGELHFSGTFNSSYNISRGEDAQYNCFKIDGNEDDGMTYIEWYYEITPPTPEIVEFDFDPYECEIPAENDFDTVVYAEGVIDTLWSYSEGMGGGYSSKSEGKMQKAENLSVQIFSGSAEFEMKTDSLNYYLSKRRFNDVKRIGNEMTNIFSDSDRVIDIIQPLYFATMVTDNENNSGISALKIKLEDLIANNSENDALVLRCNYFIQKCKVILEDYSSAMSGFYAIMQAYPYSWEGIVAGWDYSATQLISQSGQGGGMREVNGEKMSNVKGEMSNAGQKGFAAGKAEISIFDEPYGDDPKGVKKTIDKTLTDTKDKIEKQIKIEEQQVKELKSDAKNEKNIKQSKAIQKKLQQKKVMGEIIKPRTPETVSQHISFVNSDIQKIYAISTGTADVEENSSLPTSYKLEQNYPNPFNPVTKIKFELPKESKVTIEIFDILGRKVAQLINNELRQQGRYEVQFNGQNFASGIYFYRFITNDFVDTKRMVLVK